MIVSSAEENGGDPLCLFLYVSTYQLLMDSKGWIVLAGVFALGLSLYLWFSGDKQAAIFVGLWVPSLWILADLVEKTQGVDT